MVQSMAIHLGGGRLLGKLQTPARPHGGKDSVSLPVLTTAGDVREVILYLWRKPEGVNVAEELDKARKRLFEPRKAGGPPPSNLRSARRKNLDSPGPRT